MKIYTKTGDTGTTSLFSGQRVLKNNPFIKALGSVDEANSSLGIAISFLPQEQPFQKVREQLETIQHALFDVGAALATPRTTGSAKKLEKTRFDIEEIQLLEEWIDEMTAQLTPLTHFILPGGHPAGAHLHLTRSLIRRAERNVIPLYQQDDISEDVLIYLNRLSDYLFTAARFTNQLCRVPETRWQPHKTR